MRISDWSSDVCSSDLGLGGRVCAFDGAGGWRAHGALRLKTGWGDCSVGTLGGRIGAARIHRRPPLVVGRGYAPDAPRTPTDSSQTFAGARSEEHTSELQSLMRISYAVFCLKKKKKHTKKTSKCNYHPNNIALH